MKTGRTPHHPGRNEQRMAPRREDSYRETLKQPDPACCPRCGAVCADGRWAWGKKPAEAAAHTCPACRRIEDDFPAGYVTLQGPFLAAHREEVLNLVTAHAARARDENLVRATWTR